MSSYTEHGVQKQSTTDSLKQRPRSKYAEHSFLPVFLTLALLAVSFIPIGIVVVKVSDTVFDMCIRYDDVNMYSYRVGPKGVYPHEFSFNNSQFSTGARVRKVFSLTKSLVFPIYVQYRLVGFYQNYREYASSRDLLQLRGKSGKLDAECKPFRYPGEFHKERFLGEYSPCGSIAWSAFNDSFSLYKLASGSVDANFTVIPPGASLICDGSAFDKDGKSHLSENMCRKKGIALPSDVELYRYPKNISPSENVWRGGFNPTAENPFQKEGYYYKEAGHSIPAVTDEDFIVWSSIAYLPDFTKNYRIITTDLAAGDYFFDVIENYDVQSFSGEKHLCLTTTTWIGGRNYTLGILLLGMGCISFVLAVGVLVVQFGIPG